MALITGEEEDEEDEGDEDDVPKSAKTGVSWASSQPK